MKQYFVFAGISLVVALVVFFVLGTKTVQTVVKQVPVELGANPGPDFTGPCISINGLTECAYRKAAINPSATTTICSFKSPTATSTLVYGSLNVYTATTTALVVDFGRDLTPSATTTSLGTAVLASGFTGTVMASSSDASGATLGGRQNAANIFPPNTFFNVKYGGANLGSALGAACNAKFYVN